MPPRSLSSLNLLRVFEVAGRVGSFKVAGTELHVTASAVSQQIKTLEEQLGVALFVRGTRKLSLTEAGERYWRDVHAHLRALDDNTEAIRSRYSQSILRVSSMPPIASRVVLRRLGAFHELHPEIDLRLDTSIVDAELRTDAVDLAIRFGEPPWRGCHHEKLLDLYVVPVASPELAARFDLAANPSQLALLPRIQMVRRPDAWSRFFAAAGIAPQSPEREVFVDDYPAALEAAETIGVALALDPLERPLLDTKRVVALAPRLGPLPEAVYAVMLPETRNVATVRAFVDWLRSELAALD